MTYGIKDSGDRQEFDSGMVRDVTQGKTDYSLAFDGPMFERWATHLTKGAEKYDKRNWMLASGEAEYERFRESALRHFIQWYRGDGDEDHAAAVFFNINGTEYVIQNYEGPDVSGCDGCDFCGDCYPTEAPDGADCDGCSDPYCGFVHAEPDEKMERVGDVTADDILAATKTVYGAHALAEDYNYLRSRVYELNNDLLHAEGVVEIERLEADGGW